MKSSTKKYQLYSEEILKELRKEFVPEAQLADGDCTVLFKRGNYIMETEGSNSNEFNVIFCYLLTTDEILGYKQNLDN